MKSNKDQSKSSSSTFLLDLQTRSLTEQKEEEMNDKEHNRSQQSVEEKPKQENSVSKFLKNLNPFDNKSQSSGKQKDEESKGFADKKSKDKKKDKEKNSLLTLNV